MALIRFEPLGGGTRRWVPAMDLVQTADHYIVRLDLPGVREDDVTVQLEDNVLTIAGQRPAEHEQRHGYYRLERGFGAFSRSLTLPDGIDGDRVEARFDRGVLEVMIAKPERKKPRRVQIQLANSVGQPAIDSETADAQASEREPELALT
jgi:HSP20 family protein